MARKNFMDKLIPPKYDFYGMLSRQAEVSSQGVGMLVKCLEEPNGENYGCLMALVDEADVVRMKLEEDLIQAFSTPFDRQDIYLFSVRMDRILKLAKSTLLAMEAYHVVPAEMLIAMARYLSVGMMELSKATTLLEIDLQQAEAWIEKMRKANIEVGNCYRGALAKLFAGNDPMEALRQREIFNELKDASEYMELTIDVFHKIIVRLG